MNAKSRTIILVTFVLVALFLTAGLVMAQGRGNGPNNPTTPQGNFGDCPNGNIGQQFGNAPGNMFGSGTPNGRGNMFGNGTPNGRGNAFGNGNMRQMMNGDGTGTCLLGTEPTAELTSEIEAKLNEALLEEYAAFNTYEAVIDQFGAVLPFVNIVNAEAHHAEQWVLIFERYGLTAPENPGLESPLAITTLEEAYQLAVDIETHDGEFYGELLELLGENYPDIARVATMQQFVSLNHHLTAFQAYLTNDA